MEPDPQPKTALQLNSLRDIGESAIVLPDGSIVRVLGPSSEELPSEYGSTRLYPLEDHRRLRLEFVCSDQEMLTWLDSTRLALFALHWDGPFPQAEPGSWIEAILRKGPEPEPAPGGAFSGGAPRPNGGDVAVSDLISVTAAAHSEFRRNSTDPKAELKIKAVAILLKGFRKRWIAVRDWELVASPSPMPDAAPASPITPTQIVSWNLRKAQDSTSSARLTDSDGQFTDIPLGTVLHKVLLYMESNSLPQATWSELQKAGLLRSTNDDDRNLTRVDQLQKQKALIRMEALGLIQFDDERIILKLMLTKAIG